MADINNKAVNVAGLKAVYNYLVDKIKSINTDIGSVYKPCGTVKFADLPEPSAETLGHVYNIEDNFSTNDKFIEGKGKDVSAGANVDIVYVKTITNEETGAYVESYKYDLLGANVDLQGYVTQGQLTKATADMSNYVKNIEFQPDNTNTITVIKGNGQSSTYTLNVGKNADIITDITINPDIETSLGNIRHRRIARSETANSLYWVDPDESTDGDAWGETVIVKKKYSYPESIEDGTLVLTCAVKNKFKTVPYVDEQEDAANWYYRAFPISTNGGISKSILNRFDYWHFGICIDENNAIESESVSYLEGYDNADYEKLRMIFDANNNIENNHLDWGSWENASFMPRPCMLRNDGTVDYYLNTNDYTLKENGEASDVSNTEYEGNAMLEWSPVFMKVERVTTEASEDGAAPATSKLYMYFCSEKFDDDYECWSCKKSDGTYADHFYTAIYEGSIINGKLRSLSTNALPSVNTGGLAACINYAGQNGKGWGVDTWSDWDLIRCLGVLVTKRLNSQAAIGFGGTSYNCMKTGTSNKKGMFWGSLQAQNTYNVKFFGMENPWCHNWKYCAGIILPDGKTIHVKNTFSTIDGSSIEGYNDTGVGYINTGLKIPSDGYIKSIQGNSKCITAPAAVGSSDTTYYSDYAYTGSTGCFIGGGGRDASSCGFFSWGSNIAPSYSNTDYGSAVSFHVV